MKSIINRFREILIDNIDKWWFWFFIFVFSNVLPFGALFFIVSIILAIKEYVDKHNQSPYSETSRLQPELFDGEFEDLYDEDESDELVKVVGVSHTDSKRILSNVVRDSIGIWNVGGWQTHELELVLIPEPDNPYDKNAIAVFSDYPTPPRARVSRSGKIGYIPRSVAKNMSLQEPVRVHAEVLEGFDKFSVSVEIPKDI